MTVRRMEPKGTTSSNARCGVMGARGMGSALPAACISVSAATRDHWVRTWGTTRSFASSHVSGSTGGRVTIPAMLARLRSRSAAGWSASSL